MEIDGALSEIFAVLDGSGNIDVERTEKYVKFLIKNGIKGLFIGGLAAETLSFDENERINWLKTVKRASGNTPIIFQIIPSNMNSITKEIKNAEENGADVISVSQPYPMPLSNNELMDYFSFICKNTKLPVMIYNEPTIGKPLEITVLSEIIKKNNNIKFYKDSTHNLIDLHTFLMQNTGISVLAGSDGLIFDIINAGGKGVISLVANPFPKLIADEVEALRSNKLDKALELQNLIIKIRSILKMGGLTAGYRYAMKITGMDVGEPIFPYAKIDENSKIKIRNGLTSLGLIQ